MSTLDALFQEVLRSPRDDAPRLAYADALGDDPRAEFIRVQVALAGGSHLVDKAYYSARRERALLQAHLAAWKADLAPLVENLAFRRGFVEYVVSDAARFLEHGEAIRARALLLDLVLRGPHRVAAALFASPLLRGLRSLSLANDALDDDDVARLVASPHLAELRWLDLSGNQISARGMEALAAAESLPALQWLGLAHNAAEDPTPQPMLEGDRLHGSTISPLGASLRARFDRAWLRDPGAMRPDFRAF